MACPYFIPTTRFESDTWLHRKRLPLGDGWRGQCGAAGVEPGEEALKEHCNLGYAKGCPHLPEHRAADAVRFGMVRNGDARVVLRWVTERDFRPGEHGQLEYGPAVQTWTAVHPDQRIQRMAECYLESYLERTARPAQGGRATRANGND